MDGRALLPSAASDPLINDGALRISGSSSTIASSTPSICVDGMAAGDEEPEPRLVLGDARENNRNDVVTARQQAVRQDHGIR